MKIPKLVIIRITKEANSDNVIDRVAVRIKTHASHKNNINLGPFFSDEKGVVRITKEEMILSEAATIDSGMMDYLSVESAKDEVDIQIIKQADIERIIDTRKNRWKMELKGEKELYGSAKELIVLLEKSSNKKLNNWNDIRTKWIDGNAEYEYTILVN